MCGVSFPRNGVLLRIYMGDVSGFTSVQSSKAILSKYPGRKHLLFDYVSRPSEPWIAVSRMENRFTRKVPTRTPKPES